MHRRRASPSLPAPAHHVPSTSRGMLPAQPAPLRRSQPTPRQLHRQRESPWAPTLWSGLRAPSPARHPSGCVPLLPQHRDMPCAGHVSTTTAQNNLLVPRGSGVPKCLSPHVSSTGAHKERVWLPACLALVTGTPTLPGSLGYHKPIVVGVQTHYNPHCPEQDWLGAASALGTSGSLTHTQHPRGFPAGSSTWCPGLVPAAGSEQRPGWSRDGLAGGRSRGHIPTRASPAVPARLGWPWGNAPVRLCSGEESG